MATGKPTKEGTILKGFPSPYDMRTVEGDLGLRSNAVSILEEVGEKRILKTIGIKNIDLEKITMNLSQKTATIPKRCQNNLYSHGKHECPVRERLNMHQISNINRRNICTL